MPLGASVVLAPLAGLGPCQTAHHRRGTGGLRSAPCSLLPGGSGGAMPNWRPRSLRVGVRDLFPDLFVVLAGGSAGGSFTLLGGNARPHMIRRRTRPSACTAVTGETRRRRRRAAPRVYPHTAWLHRIVRPRWKRRKTAHPSSTGPKFGALQSDLSRQSTAHHDSSRTVGADGDRFSRGRRAQVRDEAGTSPARASQAYVAWAPLRCLNLVNKPAKVVTQEVTASMAQVLVAKTDISLGHDPSPENFRWQDWPQSA